MKKTLYILLIVIFAQSMVKAQSNGCICTTDTVEMLLAYEFEGQCHLDDMIYKTPELVEYKGKKITSRDYKSGVYHFVMPFWTKKIKIQNCGFETSLDSIAYATNPFHDLETKIICQRNKSFKGKGTTMVGNESTEWKYHDFKYKLFKVKFIRLHIGNENRTIVNIDRKTKLGKETTTIDCPIYVMIKIFNIELVE